MLTRRRGGAALGLAAIVASAACGVARELPDAANRCFPCHGGESGNAAPPLSSLGGRDTSDPRVGAHQRHLKGGALRRPIACAECHVVPSDIAHVDGTATLRWGPLATARGATPAFVRATGTCTGTYCHGAKLRPGGSLTEPVWTTVNGTQAACGTCHGNPPPIPPHSAAMTVCTGCHPATPGPYHLNGVLDVVDFHPPGFADPAQHGPAAIADLASCRGCHREDYGGSDFAPSCNACHEGAGWSATALASNCTFCHGTKTKPSYAFAANPAAAAPPEGVAGATSTTDPSVGAHQAHLAPGTFANGFTCDQCHDVPLDLAHLDGAATLTWGTIASRDTTPTWSGTPLYACSNYCHGATLSGGSQTAITWVTPGLSGCGSCHGNPPPIAPHSAGMTSCTGCHPATPGPSHVNGVLDVVDVHPPGFADPAQHGPAAIGGLASCRGCHGADYGGGFAPSCNACHEAAGWNATALASNCTFCHGTKTKPSYAFAANPAAAAPPEGVAGGTEPADPTVGAHQAHLAPGTFGNGFTCDQCHAVPLDLAHVDGAATLTWGTIASTDTAPTWSGSPLYACSNYCHGATLSGGSQTAITWVTPGLSGCGSCHGNPPPIAPHSAGMTSCTGCHPATPGPSHVNGVLDVVDVHPPGFADPAQHGPVAIGGLASCRGCHGEDYGGGFAPSCNACHEAAGWSATALASNCTFCHGTKTKPSYAFAANPAAAAPPEGVAGATSTADPSVGAHQAHLSPGAVSLGFTCDQCHAVPLDLAHVDGAATLTWGPLASKDTTPAWSGAPAYTCTSYCHGATLLPGGSLTQPAWTRVDGTQAACGTCHALPPPLPHPQTSSCSLCHTETVRADGSIDVAGGRHVNGTVDVVGGAGCGACHPIPPDSGAHRAHYRDASDPPLAEYGDLRILEDYAPGGGPEYAFGCGHCHPLDPARHGRHEVDLSPQGAPAGSLKARNAATAAYDSSSRTCSGVYCHSNGKGLAVRVRTAPGVITEVPPFRTTPAWNAPGSLGCAACHDNPPRYESGGAGAADANTHLQLASDSYETGHFGGLPGPWHDSKHGLGALGFVQRASPITCQTCHHETTDPAASGPSGFYWLNTTGDYVLPEGQLSYVCANCHGAGDPAAPHGTGGVLPLRHVNGRADVTFDPRTALPYYGSLPADPFTPSRPIFVTDGISPVGPDAILEPEVVPPGEWPYGRGTLSMHLSSAAYDPETKTCTNVSCHLAQTTVGWGGPTGWQACITCHGF